MPAQTPSARRCLVVIANYGNAHRDLLLRIIHNYRSVATLEPHFVVVSEASKDLGPDIEVVVGLPHKNPWSLPFAHQPIFVSRVEQYDLFIYSEDDIGVTEANIRAFLDATLYLADNEIAGFLRYETDRDGTIRLDEPWAHYHWLPASVRQRGPYTIAEFSNEHAGFYIVTQDQLRRAIQSGGLNRGPRTGRYSWPETAATDIYTVCGLKKVHCISHIDNFLIEHLSGKYVHQLDVTLSDFRKQISVLQSIYAQKHPATTLCAVESEKWPGRWQKWYYEKPLVPLIDAVPLGVRRVLSVGCGWGATEKLLRDRGAEVIALPLDSVIGGAVADQGIEMIYGELHECLRKLSGESFDCVVITNLLHLQESAAEIVRDCAALVRPGGVLAVAGLNLSRAAISAKVLFGIDGFSRLSSFSRSGFSRIGPSALEPVLQASGFHRTRTIWSDHDRLAKLPLLKRALPRLSARQWILVGHR